MLVPGFNILIAIWIRVINRHELMNFVSQSVALFRRSLQFKSCVVYVNWKGSGESYVSRDFFFICALSTGFKLFSYSFYTDSNEYDFVNENRGLRFELKTKIFKVLKKKIQVVKRNDSRRFSSLWKQQPKPNLILLKFANWDVLNIFLFLSFFGKLAFQKKGGGSNKTPIL